MAFRRGNRTVRASARVPAQEAGPRVMASASRTPLDHVAGTRAGDRAADGGGPARSLWSDTLGRASIRSLQVLIVLLLAAVTVWALLQVHLVFIPVLIAAIIASAFAPLTRWLRDKGVPRLLAAWISLLGSLAVFGGVITGIVFSVRSQWDDLVERAGEGFADLQQFIGQLPLLDEVDWEGVWESVQTFLTSAEFGSGAVAGVSTVAEVVTGVVLIVVILFFFLKDGDRIWAFFLRPLSPRAREKGERVGLAAVRTLGGYVRGTAIVALVDAVAIGIVLLILGVPLALPLAVIVFFGGFIPLVGATVATILAALVALVANGPIIALVVVGAAVLVNQLEGDLLQPVIMGRSLKLHPLAILVALTAGTILGGIIGALLSVPVAAVSWVIVKVLAGVSDEQTEDATAETAHPPGAEEQGSDAGADPQAETTP